ncbi:hypothetical protein V6Z11_A10G021300 [Gossypium hirsutum]
MVSIDASSAGGSPASAPAGASTDGSVASSSTTSQATAPSSSGARFQCWPHLSNENLTIKSTDLIQ